jgi:hypothetical protein
MNRAIKDATAKRFHYGAHDQLRTHLANFLTAYNFARRLKWLRGLTPYEYICKIWTSEPDRFIPKSDPPDAGTKQLAQARSPRTTPMFCPRTLRVGRISAKQQIAVKLAQ